MSGVGAQKGFIYQSFIAMIECLGRNDWDAIKLEPKTDDEKVDIQLYQGDKIITAIQVKSSQYKFSMPEVKTWLKEVKADAVGVNEIILYLVGDLYTGPCETYIKENKKEIKTVSLNNLADICLGRLTNYVKNGAFARDVLVSDLDLIDASLFSKIHRNSLDSEPLSRNVFENALFRALKIHNIPKCLTPIPPVNHKVGLVGREKIKKTLISMLEERGRMVLLSGLGGIGKTAVMQYICNDLKVNDNGKFVAWIDCGDSLKNDILVLGEALGITIENPDIAYKMIISTVRNRLNGSLYLFMDNLTENLGRKELSDLNSLNAHIMVTSRHTNDAFPTIQLGELEDNSAVKMFFRYYNGDTDCSDEEAAYSIVTSVNRHTLLIELLAKAANKTGGTLADFNLRLKAEGVYDVFKRKVETAHDGNITIEDCVQRLYEVSSLSAAQRHIMKLFSIFTPEKEIYYKVAEWADFDLEAMDELVNLAWLERSGSEKNYKIHQIIRDSLVRQMEKQKATLKIEEYGELLNKVIDMDDYMPCDLEYTRIQERLIIAKDVAGYLVHRTDGMMSNQAVLKKNRNILTSEAELFNNLADIYFTQGDYGYALEYYKRALAIRKRVLGTNHPDTAEVLHNMADVYSQQGEYTRSLKYYKQALLVRKKVLGVRDPSVAATYNNMAYVFKVLGYYDKAITYFNKALTITKRELGINHSSTAATYNNMAIVYEELGDDSKALEYYEKALVICKSVLSKEHPDTATVYMNIADMYSNQGENTIAVKYYETALSIFERTLGLEHPLTAHTYINMADMYLKQGDNAKALEYNERALSIFERTLGHEHPDTALTYRNIAHVYSSQEEYEKAIEYYGEAFSIIRRVLGAKSLQAAYIYCDMAELFIIQHNEKKALKYFDTALSIFRSLLREDHPSVIKIYNDMGLAYTLQGEYNLAFKYYWKALSISKKK